MAKKNKGQGFDLLIPEENNSIKENKIDKSELTKLHCDIDKQLKKRLDLFKV